MHFIAFSLFLHALPVHQFCFNSRCDLARRHDMLPRKPAGVSDELWTLELPSILGTAHGGCHDSPEPPPTPSPAQSPGVCRGFCVTAASRPVGQRIPSAAHSAAPHSGSTAPLNDSAAVLFPDLSDTEAESCAVTQVPMPFTVDSYTYDWNVSSAKLKLVLDFADATQDLQHIQPPPTFLAAESKAFAMLQSGFATFEDIGELLDCMPSCQHAKRRKQMCETGHPRQCTFSAGAYTYAHSTGIQLSTARFPPVVQLLTSIIRGACPGVQFSSLTHQKNVQVQMHTDKNNASGYESIIIPWALCSEPPGLTSVSLRFSGMQLPRGHLEIARS